MPLVAEKPFSMPSRQDGIVSSFFEREISHLRRSSGSGIVRARFGYGDYPFGNGNGWIAVGYEEVAWVFTDPRLSIVGHRHHNYPRTLANEGAKPPVPNNFSTMDGPNHLLRKRVLAKHLNARRIAALRERVEVIISRIVEDFAAGEQGADILPGMAKRVGTEVICAVLGIPEGEEDRFIPASTALVEGKVENEEDATARVNQINDYFGELHERRKRNPGDDLLSALLHDTESGAQTPEEFAGMGFLLLFAGHEAPSAILGGILYSLAHAPDLLLELKSEPELIPGAIEEFLRYLANGAGNRTRIALEDIDAFGVHIKKDEVIQPVVHGANFDERVFTNPDQINLRRNEANHMRFGTGPHACAGAQIARMELSIALEKIVSTFSSLTPAQPRGSDDADWRTGLLLRGPKTLHVTWERT